jgi:two-component system NarL family sensor kinase
VTGSRRPQTSPSWVAAVGVLQLAAVRAALVPVVLLGERLVDHPSEPNGAFGVVLTAFAAWAAAILALHLAARAGRLRLPPALERAEPFVDLAAIVALTYTSGGPFSETGMAFFVLPLLAAARLRPDVTARWAVAAVVAYVLLSVLHPTAGEHEATSRMISQVGYLAWAGLAGTLLSAVLARRDAAIATLANERGQLAAHALSAEQRERRRLAELLHDESVQTLAVAQQELGDYRRSGRDESFERARAAIAEALGQLRGEIFELHPYVLEHAGLPAALRAIADRFAERMGARITVAVDPAAAGQHDELVVVLARELLSNAARHSGAAHVVVTVAADSEQIELEVRDDGAGFDPARRAAALQDGHIGLASSERRVQMVGGELVVESAPRRGTTIRATLPRAASPATVGPPVG